MALIKSKKVLVKKKKGQVRKLKKVTVQTKLKKYLSERKTDVNTEAWAALSVPDPVRLALEKAAFSAPTEIQEKVLPVALEGKCDVFGAAETGSGKTLAFVIPIINSFLSEQRGDEKKLLALCLAPTRELALQIAQQFKRFSEFTEMRSVAIVGGLSEEKQERLLRSKPDVIVATPGRFWSLCQRNDYANDFSCLRIMVIDEIDRMVEKGHFKELVSILERVHSPSSAKIQTLVFSATLTFIVLPTAGKPVQSREAKLKEIAKITRMRKNYRVVDVTNEGVTPQTLREVKMCCNSLLDKDSNLYYLLLTYPGRTLVFTNSIDASKRLYSILLKLQLKPTPLLLHAKMQERKRLKNLDRFSNTPNAAMIATDVAARGLDIQGITNVVHYQTPRTAEDYVHRSGRTARALEKGMSVMLLDPQDVSRYKKICKALERCNELDSLTLDNQRRVEAVKQRCYLASELEKLEYQLRKVTAAVGWRRRMAKEADLMLSDEEEEMNPDGEEANKRRLKKAAEKALKSALARELPPSSL